MHESAQPQAARTTYHALVQLGRPCQDCDTLEYGTILRQEHGCLKWVEVGTYDTAPKATLVARTASRRATRIQRDAGWAPTGEWRVDTF